MKKSCASFSKARFGAFTLFEVILASTAGALILVSIYSIFFRAVRLRDDAGERTRDARLRARAAVMLREDLRNAFISGGILASTLEGGTQSSRSQFPGSLRFTSTSAQRSPDVLTTDVQEIEYFITNDPDAPSRAAGVLVRAVNRDLMSPVAPVLEPERVLEGVASMETTFFDGTSWVSTWTVYEDSLVVPKAVRVRLTMAPPEGNERPKPPLDVLVPIITEPLLAPAADTEGTTSSGGSTP